LEPGRYQIEISATGYKTVNKWVELGASKAIYVTIKKKKKLLLILTKKNKKIKNCLDFLRKSSAIHTNFTFLKGDECFRKKGHIITLFGNAQRDTLLMNSS